MYHVTPNKLESVKDIDNKTIQYIYGYIGNIQELLPNDNVYFTIPSLVIYWIILYYYIREQLLNKVGAGNFTITVWKDRYPLIDIWSAVYLEDSAGKQYGWIVNSSLRTYSSDRNIMQTCNELVKCITGDIVEYSRNGGKYVTAWDHIEDTPYIAVLSVYTEEDSIELISYEYTYRYYSYRSEKRIRLQNNAEAAQLIDTI